MYRVVQMLQFSWGRGYLPRQVSVSAVHVSCWNLPGSRAAASLLPSAAVTLPGSSGCTGWSPGCHDGGDSSTASMCLALYPFPHGLLSALRHSETIWWVASVAQALCHLKQADPEPLGDRHREWATPAVCCLPSWVTSIQSAWCLLCWGFSVGCLCGALSAIQGVEPKDGSSSRGMGGPGHSKDTHRSGSPGGHSMGELARDTDTAGASGGGGAPVGSCDTDWCQVQGRDRALVVLVTRLSPLFFVSTL